jgi:serine/threonine protein kinase
MTEESLFEAALEKRDPAERQAFLEEACAGDVQLLHRVRRLLAVPERPPDILDQAEANPDPMPATTPDTSVAVGTVIAGRYKILESLGEGGMGTVWVAEQTQPVRRKVAVKLIKGGMDSRAVLSRFEAERQALALMDHPNIAKVLDGGTTGAEPGSLSPGRPFFVMEYVKGVPLTEYCDAARLSIAQRLDLFVPICQAIQHAHQKGIIHRDLKPSNILVCLYDGKPVPKVIDFGLAKAMHQPLTERTLYTAHGVMMGTPLYMSPEQAEFNNLDVDTRADIYALGVILYELLTGTTPLEQQRIQKAAVHEMLRLIKEEEPPLPSARLSSSATLPTLAVQRQLEPAKLTRLVRGELDWIVMKCLEKDRSRRYETANSLARDIQCYLADEVVEARPPSTAYRLRKVLRRHKGSVLAACLVGLALLAGIIGTTLGLFEAKRQEGVALNAQREEAERAEAEAKERRRAEIAEADALEQKKEADANAAEAKKQEHEARKQEQEAKNKLELATAVTEFLRNDLLSQAGTEAQADRKYDVNPNLTIREALDRAAGAVSEKFKNRPELEAAIRETIGNAYRDLGQTEKAIVQLQQSADIRKAKLGPDHSDTLITLNNLALALEDVGKTTEAIELLEKVRDGQVKKLPPDDPYILTTLNNLGLAYLDVGKTTEAIALFEKVRDAQAKILVPDHPNVTSTLNNLGMAYRIAGRTSEAIALFETVRDDLVKRRGPTHPNTLATLENLAVAYLAAGRTTEALAMLEKVFDDQMKIFGPDHPAILLSMDNLASAYQEVGRTTEAIALFEKLRDAEVKKFGADHPFTMTTLNNLAMTYGQAKQFEKAIPLLEKMLEVQRKKHGELHPDTLRTMANLGVIYRDADRVEEAIPLLEQAYREGRKNPALGWVGGKLLTVYIRAGKTAEGSALAKENLEAARKALAADSPQLAGALAQTGMALLQLKAWSDAETVLRECLAIREKKEPDAWTTFNTKSMLGEALLGRKQFADAEPLLLDGYEGMKKRADKIPPQGKIRLHEALERLVQLYEATDKKDEAAKWRKELERLKEAEKNAKP